MLTVGQRAGHRHPLSAERSALVLKKATTMFAHHTRPICRPAHFARGLLAAAAIVTMLAGSSPSAAASPISPPAASEQVMIDPGALKLPDISVRGIGKHFGPGEVVVYEFEITNKGRAVAHNVSAKRFVGLRHYDGSWYKWEELPTVNIVGDIEPGGVRHLDVNCVPPGGTFCSSGILEVPALPGEVVRNNNQAGQQ
jgi:hypothetical protein